ncbi:potassium channel family protein [Paraburkholderia phymatum]|uniref:potassium channel family protein n=1 Tax=Paraburkholderia phymatum TaxID=148447 RepID=UPI00316B092D
MYLAGGAVNAGTRTRSSMSETFYICAVTALTVGYGDVVPTTAIGRIVAVVFGLQGLLVTGVTTASVVFGIQAAGPTRGYRATLNAHPRVIRGRKPSTSIRERLRPTAKKRSSRGTPL